MISANCPSCGGALKKLPQRKTKCPHCGEFMFVRATPGGERHLVTAAVADAIDRDWAERAEHAAIDRVAGIFGWPAGLSLAALRGLLAEKMHDPTDRSAGMQAATQAAALARTEGERSAAHRWYYVHQLGAMAERGVSAVTIRGGLDACPACSALAGRELPIGAALEQLVPSPECDAVKRSRPCCAFWSPSLVGNPYLIGHTT